MLDRRNLLIAAAALPIASEAAAAAKDNPHPALVGGWSLVDAVTVEQDGTIGPWEGKPRPYTGLIAFLPSGYMAVQIANPRAALAHDADFTQLPADQRLAYLDSYYAYFAKWAFDAAQSIVTFHVASALDPTEIGIVYRRKVAIANDVLTLTTINDINSLRGSHNVLTWRRT